MTFQATTAGRWLPRVLALATMVAAMFSSMRIQGVDGTPWSLSKWVVLLSGLALGFGVIKYGALAVASFELDDEDLIVKLGAHERRLPYEQVTQLKYDGPFERRRQWLPALIVLDRFGVGWRVPSLIRDGDRFVDALIERTGKDEMAAYADAHQLREKMARWQLRERIGYAIALLLVVVSGLFYYFAP